MSEGEKKSKKVEQIESLQNCCCDCFRRLENRRKKTDSNENVNKTSSHSTSKRLR